MAKANSTRHPAGSPLSTSPPDMDHHITRVDQIIGVVRLARESVFQEAGEDRGLGASWTALDMALHTLDELRYDLEGVPQQYRWNEAQRIHEHQSRPIAAPESSVEAAEESGDDRTQGQCLYDNIAERERQLKSLLDEIPYSVLDWNADTCRRLDDAAAHLSKVVIALQKVSDREVPRYNRSAAATTVEGKEG